MSDELFYKQVDFILKKKISDIDRILELIKKISNAIKQDKSKGKEYGALISELSNYMKENLSPKRRKKTENRRRKRITGVTDKKSYWQIVKNGWLKIGHRPGNTFYDDLLKDKTTTVLTLLGENEEPYIIEKNVRKKGMDWLWISLPNAKIPPENMLPEIINIFEILNTKLENKERIYIHCAAGMHRTGMITNAFLLFLGFSSKDAFELLFKLRPLTAQEVRNHRLEWGENNFT